MKIIRTSTVASSLDFLLKGQLAFLNKKYEVVAVSGQDKHLGNVACREGVRIEVVEMQRSISPLKDLVSLWKLFWLFKKEQPQIVHSITPKAGLLSMLAAKLAGVPIRMHTFTGLIFPSKTGFLQQLLIFMDRLLCACATHIYPEGQGVKNDLIKYKITTKPLKVIANGNVNGIDIAYFEKGAVPSDRLKSLRRELSIKDNDFVFVFVGRLVKDKGIEELVNAFDQLVKRHPSVKLLLVGPEEKELDPLSSSCLNIIQNNPAIISVGFQNDVRPYLALSKVLTFPSYREGFPNVPMQAGCFDLPCIVTDINGCNEIIVAGENGLIIPVKDTTALKIAMEKLYLDKNLYNALSAKSRQMIIDRYEQEKVWALILAEYQAHLKQKGIN